ncbi:hypothetical protein RFI_07271, partial [Reticulomyxa filosa]
KKKKKKKTKLSYLIASIIIHICFIFVEKEKKKQNKSICKESFVCVFASLFFLLPFPNTSVPSAAIITSRANASNSQSCNDRKKKNESDTFDLEFKKKKGDIWDTQIIIKKKNKVLKTMTQRMNKAHQSTKPILCNNSKICLFQWLISKLHHNTGNLW